MSEDMNIVDSVVQDAITVVDKTLDRALETVSAVEDALVAVVQSSVNVADNAADDALDELSVLKAKMVEVVRKFASTVTEPLP